MNFDNPHHQLVSCWRWREPAWYPSTCKKQVPTETDLKIRLVYRGELGHAQRWRSWWSLGNNAITISCLAFHGLQQFLSLFPKPNSAIPSTSTQLSGNSTKAYSCRSTWSSWPLLGHFTANQRGLPFSKHC